MAHQYGPNREADHPQLVNIAPDRRDPELVPLAPAIVRQRAHLNAIAHHGRLSRGPCRTCGRDEWDCPVRPAAADPDVHEYEPSR